MKRRLENVLKKKVSPELEGLRLDVFLHKAFPLHSRAYLQKLIREERVTAGGRPRKQSYSVGRDEEIEVHLPEPAPLGIEPEPLPLDIRYEDAELAVVNKPAGMVVHPGAGVSSGTLVHALLFHLKDLSGIGGIMRPGIVHRLDKGTSGILVVAKTDLSHRNLSSQLKDRKFEKEYLAIVWGSFRQKTGKIATSIGRHKKDRVKMAVVKEGGREAITFFKVLRESRFLTLVSLKPVTGRTHQLRVHLSHIGHPIFGDDRYGGRRRSSSGLKQEDKRILEELLGIMERPALHARKVAFSHPSSGKRLCFFAKLPPDFRAVMRRLKIA
ncbi:MAG: RluA family pseudouridine synthase [Candidatus Eisenbacteria bacterium]|nr:RluA family pseudouridine synthase [Candidatus Eisenbacteria bacterium]